MSEIRMTALVVIKDSKVVEFQTVKDWTECTVFAGEGKEPICISQAAAILVEELKSAAGQVAKHSETWR